MFNLINFLIFDWYLIVKVILNDNLDNKISWLNKIKNITIKVDKI